MTARQPRASSCRRASRRDLHGAAVVRALRARLPGAAHRRVRRAAHGGGRRHRAVPDGGARGVRLRRGPRARSPRTSGCSAAASATSRAGGYDLVILIDYPGFHLRVAEAAQRRRRPGALLHRAAALGLAARSARAGSRRAVRPARGDPAVRGGVLPRRRRRRPSTWAIRCSTAARRPVARRGARDARHSGRTSGCSASFPAAATRRFARLWPPFRDAARAAARARARATASLVAGTPIRATIPTAGRSRLIRGRSARRCSRPPMRPSPSRAPRRSRRRSPTRRWWWPTGCIRSPRSSARRLVTVQWVSLVNLVAEREVVPEILQEQRRRAARLAEARRAAARSGAIPRTRGAARGPRAGARAARDARRGRPGRRHRRASCSPREAPALAGAGPRHRAPGRLARSPAPGGSSYRARPERWRRGARGQAAARLRCSGTRRCCRCSGSTGASAWRIVVSEARDGQYLAEFAEAARLPAAARLEHPGRGAGAAGAVRELAGGHQRRLHARRAPGPAPRVQARGGPRGAARRGAARPSGARRGDRAWRLRSWDRFVIPKPCARVRVAYGDPIRGRPRVGGRFGGRPRSAERALNLLGAAA